MFFISELFTPNSEEPPPSLVQLPVNSLPFFVRKTKLVLFGSGFLPTWLPTWEQKTWKCIHFKTCLFFCTLWVITADTHSTSWPNTHTLGGSLSGSDRKWCPFSFQVCLGLIVSNGNFRNLNRRRTQNCWLKESRLSIFTGVSVKANTSYQNWWDFRTFNKQNMSCCHFISYWIQVWNESMYFKVAVQIELYSNREVSGGRAFAIVQRKNLLTD